MTYTILDKVEKPSKVQIFVHNSLCLLLSAEADSTKNPHTRWVLIQRLLNKIKDKVEEYEDTEEIPVGLGGVDWWAPPLIVKDEESPLQLLKSLEQRALTTLRRLKQEKQRLARRVHREIEEAEADTIASRVTAWRTPSRRRLLPPPPTPTPIIMGYHMGVAYTSLEELQDLLRFYHTYSVGPEEWLPPRRRVVNMVVTGSAWAEVPRDPAPHGDWRPVSLVRPLISADPYNVPDTTLPDLCKVMDLEKFQWVHHLCQIDLYFTSVAANSARLPSNPS